MSFKCAVVPPCEVDHPRTAAPILACWKKSVTAVVLACFKNNFCITVCPGLLPKFDSNATGRAMPVQVVHLLCCCLSPHQWFLEHTNKRLLLGHCCRVFDALSSARTRTTCMSCLHNRQPSSGARSSCVAASLSIVLQRTN